MADIEPTAVAAQVPKDLWTVATEALPDLFQPFICDVVMGLSWPAPITCGLFVAASGLMAWRVRKEPPRVRPTVILMLLYVPFYLLCYAVTTGGLEITPRYLFPILPVVAVVGGLAMSRIPGWAWTSIAGYLVAAFVFLNVSLIRHPRLYEHFVFCDPADIRHLARTLDRLDCRFVQATPIIEWRLLFETQERIIAVSFRPPLRYLPYARRLASTATQPGTRIAYVFLKDDRWSKAFYDLSPEDFVARYLKPSRVAYQVLESGPYVIFIVQRE